MKEIKMKVLYDHQIFSVQKIGGISRYFYEVYKRNKKSKISLVYTENFYLKKIKVKVKFKGKNRVFKILNKIKSIIEMIKSDYEIFHPTYYDNYFFKYNKKPFVITVHDMIHEIYKGTYFKEDDITIEQKKNVCRKADGIIAISNKTKEDLINILGVDSKKIKVIYHGSNLEKINVNVKLPKKYILFVGSRWGYKNFGKFLEAISEILSKNKKISLLCIGNSFTKNESIKIKELGLENQIFQKIAEDIEMYTIYKNAECFVFPSLYEGFGIPILEAYESECPVVLSNASCFPEIAEEAGEYFDPENINSIKNAVEYVLYNEERKKELIKLGKNQLKKFSWDKTAKQTEDFYYEVLKNQEFKI